MPSARGAAVHLAAALGARGRRSRRRSIGFSCTSASAQRAAPRRRGSRAVEARPSPAAPSALEEREAARLRRTARSTRSSAIASRRRSGSRQRDEQPAGLVRVASSSRSRAFSSTSRRRPSVRSSTRIRLFRADRLLEVVGWRPVRSASTALWNGGVRGHEHEVGAGMVAHHALEQLEARAGPAWPGRDSSEVRRRRAERGERLVRVRAGTPRPTRSREHVAAPAPAGGGRRRRPGRGRATGRLGHRPLPETRDRMRASTRARADLERPGRPADSAAAVSVASPSATVDRVVLRAAPVCQVWPASSRAQDHRRAARRCTRSRSPGAKAMSRMNVKIVGKPRPLRASSCPRPRIA